MRVKGVAIAPKVSDISFDLFPGEVLGVVALEGQGQDELFECMAGFMPPRAGSIEVNGVAADFRHPADAIAAGVKFVPGDRADALLAQRSVLHSV